MQVSATVIDVTTSQEIRRQLRGASFTRQAADKLATAAAPTRSYLLLTDVPIADRKQAGPRSSDARAVTIFYF